MPILDRLQGPADLRGLTEPELEQLAGELRETIIRTVAATGGHLGSSLGVVEITLALHRLLESPRDRIVWDTGHQAYAHKLLTGRLDRFHTLRQIDGVGGFPRRTESEHDVFDGGHAGTGLSIARGPRDGARHPPQPRAGRGRRRRRGAAVGAQPRGAQRHRAPPEPAADRAQRQRDVDQPVGRGAVEVPVRDQALRRVAAEQGRVRQRDRGDPADRAPAARDVAPVPAVRRLVRAARAAVRGPGHHLHRRHARPRPAACSRRRSVARSPSTGR